jgi:hypothetical protein
MQTPSSLLPDLPTLTARLTAAFDGEDSSRPPLTIVERTLPEMMCTFPNEVVTCRMPEDRELRVFIKYGHQRGHLAYGHRGNVTYEAEVYRRVLEATPGYTPKCLGTHVDEETNETWLMLECVDPCTRVSDISRHLERRLPEAMVRGARRIAQFHAAQQNRVAGGEFPFLIHYDAEYFRGWPRRTAAFAAPLFDRYPWLPGLCDRAEEWMAPLLAAAQTVIHGEFYVKHILLRQQEMYLVDWESAAVAAGEIDLATMTEGRLYTPEVVRLCEREYQAARWPEGSPAGFERTVDAARIYLHFRWLGDQPDWTVREKTRWRYDHLHGVAARLGLI